jgi:hypothetical protein
MDRNYNFMPAVKCPYCGKLAHPEISGWGGTLSTRTKFCRYCENEYTLVVYSYADTDNIVTPTKLNQMKRHIRLLKERIAREQMKVISHSADLADEVVRVMAVSKGRQN